MRKKLGLFLNCALMCVLFMFVLAGCGEDQSGQTINGPEITGEYLAGEYSQQLITDGAETVLGAVTMEKSGEDSYSVHISEREVVANANYKEGYYVADNNITHDVSFGFDGRIACIENGELIVKSPDEFIEEQDKDSGDEKLYTVYLMGESAELILETEPEDVETE